MGEKWASVIYNVDKTIFIAGFSESMLNQRRMVLITPPFAEHETGFELWLGKVFSLSVELSTGVVHYGDCGTRDAISEYLKGGSVGSNYRYAGSCEREDYFSFSEDIQEDDLIVLVSARKNTLSYSPVLDGMPGKLDHHFQSNNKLIIFPKQAREG